MSLPTLLYPFPAYLFAFPIFIFPFPASLFLYPYFPSSYPHSTYSIPFNPIPFPIYWSVHHANYEVFIQIYYTSSTKNRSGFLEDALWAINRYSLYIYLSHYHPPPPHIFSPLSPRPQTNLRPQGHKGQGPVHCTYTSIECGSEKGGNGGNHLFMH